MAVSLDIREENMKQLYFYLLTIVAVIILVITFYTKNIYFVIISFFIAINLKKYVKDIPLPKGFQKHNILHIKTLKDK